MSQQASGFILKRYFGTFKYCRVQIGNGFYWLTVKQSMSNNVSLYTSIHWRLVFSKTSQYLQKKTFKKQSPTQVFFCEYCKIFKNTYFEEHLTLAVLYQGMRFLLASHSN